MLKTIPWICFLCLYAHGLERPRPDTLQKYLKSSQSLMSPAFKSEVQKRIEHMDRQLYTITLSRGILVTEIPEIASWVDL
ncbi:MAG: hypothetical protein JW774_09040, partial [Candidatus Aureabacteria bacterium]|nr:hypothetical protein [Candidatus Auribacterota bacterium]